VGLFLRAVAVLATMAIVPAAAGDFEFCAGNNGQAISKCPKTCTPPCLDSAFVSRSITIRDACRGIMGVPQNQRVNAPECEEEEEASATPDACSAFAMPTGDETIPAMGASPPACLHSFAHLRCRFDSLADRIKALNSRFTPMVSRYRPLREQIHKDQDPDEVEHILCAVSLQDMSTDYRTSEALGEDVKHLTKDFAKQTACVDETQKWIRNLQFTSIMEKGPILDAIIKGLNRRLAEPMKAQAVVEGLMTDVQKSRSVILDTYQLHRAVCDPVRR
jgi:hypothetical protein